MLFTQLIVLLLLSTQQMLCQDYVDECPVENGFFADAVQCDRYYECKNGEITDNYCPDGLVYEESSNGFAKCSFPFSVDCEGRPELQPPKPTRYCPRQNGYFAHEDPTVCDKFYFCVDGVPNPITCPASLIFDPNLGQCAYSDSITRKGCSASEVFKFDCPKVTDARHEHPRYPDPNDCQFFYICISGQARRNGCTDGQVFNKETLACDAQFNVKNDVVCQQWYNETFLEGIQVPPSPGAVRGIGGGVPIDTSNRQRVVVRRRKPSTQVQQQVSVSQSETISSSAGGGVAPNFNQFSGARPTVAPTFNQVPRNRQKVRTRVRRPPAIPEAELVPLEEGPPKFALASDEDIQRFRDSNRFGPGSSNGRLTVLNNNGGGGSFQQPPQRQGGDFQQPPQRQGGNFQQPQIRQGGNFQQPQQRQQGGNFQQSLQRQGGNFQQPPPQRQQPNNFPVEDPSAIQSFAGFAAVPDVPPLEDYDEDPIVPTFGNRFKSRRPPSRNPVPVQTLPERIIPEQTEPAFGSNFRSRPAVPDSNSFESLPSRSNVRNRPAAAVVPVSDDFPSRSNFRSRPPPSPIQSDQSQITDSFEAQRQTPRQRLQVTEIKVRPQLAQEFSDQESSLDIDAFRRVANQFRQRGSQQ